MSKIFWVIAVLAVIVVAGIYIPRRSVSPGPLATSTPIVSTTTPITPPATTTPAETITPYGSVTLALKESAHFADVVITPTSVVEDSRCPMGVYCIQAGTVRVRLTLYANKSTTTQTVTLNKSITINKVSIILVEVNPPKAQNSQIKDSDYRFSFKVEKAGVGPSASAGCYVGGCSGEVCSSDPNVVSTCIYSPAYACYKSATCERQTNGQCGWTQTSALQMCLAQNSGQPSVQ